MYQYCVALLKEGSSVWITGKKKLMCLLSVTMNQLMLKSIEVSFILHQTHSTPTKASLEIPLFTFKTTFPWSPSTISGQARRKSKGASNSRLLRQ